MRDTPASPGWLLVFAAWLLAAVATLGALFMSEVMALAPCVLCWYQRICMFPLVLVLALGLFPFDARVVRYALPLAVIGALIALLHLLLMAGIVPEAAVPCRQGIPCKTAQITWLGFITIPLLSAVAFSGIAALLVAAHFKSKT